MILKIKILSEASMTTFSDPFTQGGQTQLHKFHMIRQVLLATIKIAFWMTFVAFFLLIFKDHKNEEIWFFLCYIKAVIRSMMHALPDGFFDTGFDLQGHIISDAALCNKPVFFVPAKMIGLSLLKKLIQSIFIFLSLSFLISIFWIVSGKKKRATKILSGYTLSSPKELQLLVEKKGASRYKIANIPLPKGAEFQHMMITGTTGSGKSNAITHLIQQIRKQGDQAIIVDTTGSIFAKFFDEKTDIILNPLDQRSASWDLWKEILSPQLCDEIASSFIPENPYDSFWNSSAKQVFSECLKILIQQKKTSYQALLNLTLKMPLKDMFMHLQGTSVASFMDPSLEKTSLSIRATLSLYLRVFELFEDQNEGFSIIPFLEKNHDDWLFLSCLPDQRELLKPLFSTWIALVIKGLMRREENRDKKTWLIIDELASLQKIPSLLLGLAEVRKYGGCFVLGFQDLSQLEEIYGNATSKTLSNLTGTKVLFRSVDTHIAERISKYLGDQEKMESSESISFGAHQMRDGVNLSDQKNIKPVVRASDIMMLEDLEAYLKLPGNFPISKVKFEYLKLSFKNEYFVAKQDSNTTQPHT